MSDATPPTATEVFLESARVLRTEIDRHLERYTQYDADCPAALRDAIRHSLLAPAKRLRPVLVLMATRACGSEYQRAIPAACAIEMVHTYSLIHDDLPAMDDDDLRRGLPTCHAKYGEAVAILAGDALLAQAFELIARDIVPAEAAVRCVAELGRAAGASALVGGQADDLEAEFSAGTLAELEAIHRRKTGALFLAALRMGAMVADASQQQFAALDRYGEAVGLAFQITDDLLDYAGDAEAMGKRAGKDLDRGKLTFPGLLGVAESRQRAEQLVAQATDALAVFGAEAAGLEGLARYVLDRNR